jgi:integrase
VLWVLIATTGLRRGEALGVRWQDLDLDERILRVRQSVVIYENKPVMQEPKSPAARRSIKLAPEAVAMLRTHRTAQLERRLALGSIWHDNVLVFCTGDGQERAQSEQPVPHPGCDHGACAGAPHSPP